MTYKSCNHRWTLITESEVSIILNVKKKWRYFWCEICGAIKQIALEGDKRVMTYYHPSRSKKK